ncbi:hypothetical protein, partial [Vibrio crassostreae]|uniref:hypothetical protein n=1 Tax=Vibrio crassostreae TaxID=246167 RepID=UPI00246877E8
AQSLIVLFPVSYLLFSLAHVVTNLITTEDQIAGFGKGSTDLVTTPHQSLKNVHALTLRIKAT